MNRCCWSSQALCPAEAGSPRARGCRLHRLQGTLGQVVLTKHLLCAQTLISYALYAWDLNIHGNLDNSTLTVTPIVPHPQFHFLQFWLPHGQPQSENSQCKISEINHSCFKLQGVLSCVMKSRESRWLPRRTQPASGRYRGCAAIGRRLGYQIVSVSPRLC